MSVGKARQGSESRETIRVLRKMKMDLEMRRTEQNVGVLRGIEGWKMKRS